MGLIEESPCREESCRGECCRGESCRYIYIYRYIETVTSLPDRQCPEQGRFFFVVQDFVLGYVYIYIYISIYLCTRTLSSECIYAYVYLCIYTRTLSSEVNMYIYMDNCIVCIVM